MQDNPMLNSTARLLPLQEKADCPENSQGKKFKLDDIKSAEFSGSEIMTKIEGGESNRTPEGKPCKNDCCCP